MTEQKAVPLTVVPGRKGRAGKLPTVVQGGRSDSAVRPRTRKVADSLSLLTGRAEVERRSTSSPAGEDRSARRTVMQLMSWDGRRLFSLEKV